MEEFKLVSISAGYFVKVDPSDYEDLMRWKWQAHNASPAGRTYARRRDYANGGRSLAMHRYLLNAPNGLEVDHINHDTLDNRRCNLRLGTKSQNLGNRLPQVSSSRFRGVHWNKPRAKWTVNVQGKHYGIFVDEVRAAQQYDRAALEAFGEFANLNFPEQIDATRLLPLHVRAKYTSEYRGVSWTARYQKWVAFITVDGKSKNLGLFESELEAAEAYRAADDQRKRAAISLDGLLGAAPSAATGAAMDEKKRALASEKAG